LQWENGIVIGLKEGGLNIVELFVVHTILVLLELEGWSFERKMKLGLQHNSCVSFKRRKRVIHAS